jgi:hypothetical protein
VWNLKSSALSGLKRLWLDIQAQLIIDCTVQVREIGDCAARKGAAGSLRQEDRFQELMHDPAV